MIDVKDRDGWRDQDLACNCFEGQCGQEKAVFTVTKSEYGRLLPFYGS